MSNLSKTDRAELRQAYDASKPLYDQAIKQVHAMIRDMLEQHNYTPNIKYRIKHFNAYYEKLCKNKQEGGMREQPLADLIGLRIITPFIEDVERIEALLSEQLDIIEVERKGAEHSFREFGYDSVHLVAKLDESLLKKALPGTAAVYEIQLRTILQDAWAEVEHELIYKSDIDLPNLSIRRKLASLNASLALSDLIFQEIRDFQKDLRLKGQKRRRSLEKTLDFAEQVSISTPPVFDKTSLNDATLEPMKPIGGTRLERLTIEALSAHSNNDFAEAIRRYNQILKMKPEPNLRSLIYSHRGMAYFSLTHYLDAIKDFNQAIEADQRNYRAYCNRALAYRMTGEFNNAISDYDTAISLEPSLIDGFWGRAQTLFEMKLFKQVIDDCNQILSLQADFMPASELSKVAHSRINL